MVFVVALVLLRVYVHSLLKFSNYHFYKTNSSECDVHLQPVEKRS